jgi:hypothetical protein
MRQLRPGTVLALIRLKSDQDVGLTAHHDRIAKPVPDSDKRRATARLPPSRM